MIEPLIGEREQTRKQAATVIALVAADARSNCKRAKLAIIVGEVVAIVYGDSYWLVQKVDHAPVPGSIGLFVVLGVIMFLRRNIDWYLINVASGSITQQAVAPTEPTT